MAPSTAIAVTAGGPSGGGRGSLVEFLMPVVIVLGLVPELEAALSFTVVVLTLFFDARLLLELVYRRRPASV